MKLKALLIIPLLLVLTTIAFAATVDTALTHSKAMNRDIKAVVVKPETYSANIKYPTLYLLHGYSGGYKDWARVPAIKTLADQYQVIIICPDGGYASWYFDSPQVKDSQYETYIATELVAYIDKNYSTIGTRAGRAITGLSMGGHGALYLAFKHQDVFGAAGSMSGGVDVRAFSDRFGVDKVLGPYSKFPDRWEQNSVINMTSLLTPKGLAITFDCGVDDFMLRTNISLHEKLLERAIPHDFTLRPGGHTWDYWTNSIKFQMVFFSNFFNKPGSK